MNQSFALKRTKDVLWVIAIAGGVAMVGRIFFGLGASTNLTDGLPWGMWKILNMVAGVCLATGGFIVAMVVYIFKLEKYRPLVRPAVLVAFLGYGASCFALMWDIGLPHRIWHPMIPTMWNVHSFLFEVAMCVMFYFAVSTLELMPILFERFPWTRVTHFLHEIALPFIVIGITLSTLHHSSLGSLFMVSPTRLHPIWFSQWIPVEFFTSSIASGMSAIVLITIIYAKLYEKNLNMPMLTGMAKASAIALIVYAGIRATDFTLNDKWKYVFGEMTWESYLFLFEALIEVILPVIILLTPKWRNSVKGLTLGTTLAVMGVVIYRLNVGILGYFRDAGEIYIPSLSEVAFSLGVFAAAGLFFFFIAERFFVFDAPGECAAPEARGAHVDKAPQWTLAELISVFNNPNAMRISIIVVITIPLSLLAFSNSAVRPYQWEKQPAQAPAAVDQMRTQLLLNGDRDDNFVVFPHELHKQAAYAGDRQCSGCHHLDLPNDNSSPCSECHTDMQLPNDIFDHDYHQETAGGTEACDTCHNLNLPKGPENAKACFECHEKDMNGITRGTKNIAPGYVEAMHGKCLTCHRMVGKENANERESLSNCMSCHPISTETKQIGARF